MKRLLPLLLLASPLAAQWTVYDPANHGVNLALHAAQNANHLEVLRQWAQQLSRLNQQIQQLEQQLAEQRRIRQVLGDPLAAGGQLLLGNLGATDLLRTYGQDLRSLQRLADAVASLKRDADGLFRPLDDTTILGQPFARRPQPYRRYAAVDLQSETLGQVFDTTRLRTDALQRDLAASLQALRTASTQAEVDKLGAHIAALNGQVQLLAAQRRDEADKLLALHVQNENQDAKERQDLLERQAADERQSVRVVDAWQKAVRLSPSSYTRP
jgi:hypothetical protein